MHMLRGGIDTIPELLFVIVFLAVPTFLIIILSNINRTFKNTGKYRINPA
jgi:hypothetical protein